MQQTITINVNGAQNPTAIAEAIMKRWKQVSPKGMQYSS
jgi:hypothetical protein